MTMSTNLAQTVALVTHGDAWLRVGGAAPELFPDHSAFRHVRKLAFVRSEPPVFSQRRESDPATAPWYQDLRDRGASALKMATWRRQEKLPDHIAVAFAGYALWGVQAVCEGSWELWAPECSGYTAIYRCYSIDAPLPMPPFDEADRALREALEAAIGFTRKAEDDFGVTYFTDALALRDEPQPEIPDYPEFLPERGYSAEARRLLACASKAWVFGGAGSWNDLGFDDPELKAEYERLTPRLFDAVLNAIAAAANAGEG